nr:hypothetical protein [uncultured Desulfobulbus sp.]
MSIRKPGGQSNSQPVLQELRSKGQELAWGVVWGAGEDVAWAVVAAVWDVGEDGEWEVADGVGVDLRRKYDKTRYEYRQGAKVTIST